MKERTFFPRSFTVTKDILVLLDAIAKKMNTTRSGALRRMVAERAKRWKITGDE